jgi:hypothetical protein
MIKKQEYFNQNTVITNTKIKMIKYKEATHLKKQKIKNQTKIYSQSQIL